MRAAIRKLGNSSGVIIPKTMLAELGVAAGDTVDLSLEDGRIAITPVRRRPREGFLFNAETRRALRKTRRARRVVFSAESPCSPRLRVEIGTSNKEKPGGFSEPAGPRRSNLTLY